MKKKIKTSSESVLITGANGGIGRELCAAFTGAGFFVLASDIQPEAICTCKDYIQLDLATYPIDETQRQNLREKITEINSLAPLNCLINNAAIQIIGPMETLDSRAIQSSFNVNVLSSFALIQDCISMLEGNSGSIINISSIHAHLTKPNFTIYAASKAALSSLTRALAVELGSRVRVNAIEPAAIETNMLHESFADNNAKFNLLRNYHPTKEIGSPTEVAKLCVMLTTSKLPFLNGSIIKLDGGISSCLHDPA